jgi:hypothetical protein
MLDQGTLERLPKRGGNTPRPDNDPAIVSQTSSLSAFIQRRLTSSTHLGSQLGDDPVRILFPHRPLPETFLSLGEAKGLHSVDERRGHVVSCRLLRSLRIVRARTQVGGETGDEDGPEVVQRARCLLFSSKGGNGLVSQ